MKRAFRYLLPLLLLMLLTLPALADGYEFADDLTGWLGRIHRDVHLPLPLSAIGRR